MYVSVQKGFALWVILLVVSLLVLISTTLAIGIQGRSSLPLNRKTQTLATVFLDQSASIAAAVSVQLTSGKPIAVLFDETSGYPDYDQIQLIQKVRAPSMALNGLPNSAQSFSLEYKLARNQSDPDWLYTYVPHVRAEICDEINRQLELPGLVEGQFEAGSDPRYGFSPGAPNASPQAQLNAAHLTLRVVDVPPSACVRIGTDTVFYKRVH